MKRITDRDFKLGFDGSDKLPSYESVYERLRMLENMIDDSEIIFINVQQDDLFSVIPIDQKTKEVKEDSIRLCSKKEVTYYANVFKDNGYDVEIRQCE